MAEGARLESVFRGNSNVGSNPTLSASLFEFNNLAVGDTENQRERLSLMNRGVNLTKRIKTAGGLRYCAVVVSANGRIKPDVVLVNGVEERHPESSYYLEWRDGIKRVRVSVGKRTRYYSVAKAVNPARIF